MGTSFQLSKASDYYGFATATTGGTSINVEVDMDNAEGVEFIGVAGTTSTAATLTLSTAASTTDSFTNLSGATAASTGAAAVVVCDLVKPRERWCKGTLTTTANARLTLVARKYGMRKQPVTSTSTAVVTSLVSPDT